MRSVKWSPDGDSLILSDRNAFCFCYLNDAPREVEADLAPVKSGRSEAKGASGGSDAKQQA